MPARKGYESLSPGREVQRGAAARPTSLTKLAGNLDSHVLTGRERLPSLSGMPEERPIKITIPGYPGDPRAAPEPPAGVEVRHVPELHPDDIAVIDGIPVTSVSRTLIDLAECMDESELRACFENARARGLLDRDQLLASRSRVEWRPSLAMFDRVLADYS